MLQHNTYVYLHLQIMSSTEGLGASDEIKKNNSLTFISNVMQS